MRIVGLSESEAAAPAVPGPQAITDSARHVPGFRHGTMFLTIHEGLREGLGSA